MNARILAGFIVGWLTYTGVWIVQDYQGVLDIFAQPMLAAMWSLVFTGIASVVGNSTRKTRFQKTLDRIGYGSLLLAVAGIICIIFPEELGLTHEEIHTETGKLFQARDTIPMILSYFFVIFPFVNWPEKKKASTEQTAPPDRR